MQRKADGYYMVQEGAEIRRHKKYQYMSSVKKVNSPVDTWCMDIKPVIADAILRSANQNEDDSARRVIPPVNRHGQGSTATMRLLQQVSSKIRSLGVEGDVRGEQNKRLPA
ncbi:hypothetical protein T265_03182 [Opisthorchis viverrini]|uniref:Uncharacterized protein n=1 Tax=Opisthorchis viverrini TaxID=6198 RepID=A0A075AHR4_OPIVI|nr:hypothetical protein T265_03182 [Opisthorchis viverrini]KER30339.1 hypothetical protein T265_03182 [Opisthorchis viverrini]